MEHNCHLGIYIAANTATGAVLKNTPDKTVVLDCFTVATDPAEDNQPGAMAPFISRAMANKDFQVAEINACIDCALYTQHNLRSDFTDYRQVAGTIKFDTEDAAAADITQLATAFQITRIRDNGSDVSAFTADRDLLSRLLTDLHASGIDPLAIEPDIVCLARFLRLCGNRLMSEHRNAMFVILSEKSCYIIAQPLDDNDPPVRSFLLGAAPHRTETLARQITLTLASLNHPLPVEKLMFTSADDRLDISSLGEKLSLQVETFDIASALTFAGGDNHNCPPAALAMACGAATIPFGKTKKVDLRQDFAPYEGKKLLLQKSLRTLSIAVTVLVLALGAYFQLQVLKNNSDSAKIWNRIDRQYSAVMYGKNADRTTLIPKLKSALNTAQSAKQGIGSADDNSVTAKMTFVLEAINKTPAAVDLNINDISITEKTIRLTGDTKSKNETLQFFKSINEHPKLKKSYENLNQKGDRDTFTVNLEIKQ